jgi:polar amino acid transport system substrate-binding protein
VNASRLVAFAVIAVILVGCLPKASSEPTPTPSATSARPRFELATYMYALQTKAKIRIAALDKDGPFAARDSSGMHAGFEVDLGRELAKAIFGPQQDIDSVIEWVPVDRSTAVTSITSLQADVVIAKLAVTPESASAIDLSDPYFITGQRILVASANDDIKSLADLDTKTVCFQVGSDVEAHLAAANDSARTLALDTYASCVGALKAGQADAIGASEPVLWTLLRENPDTKLVGEPLTTERYAIGVKKNTNDRQGFLPFLNTWLAGVIRDGTWGRLYAQHITPLSKDTKTSP